MRAATLLHLNPRPENPMILTQQETQTLAEIRNRFAYQEAERFVTGYEEDIRFLLRLLDRIIATKSP